MYTQVWHSDSLSIPQRLGGWDVSAGSFSENCLQWGESFCPSHTSSMGPLHGPLRQGLKGPVPLPLGGAALKGNGPASELPLGSGLAETFVATAPHFSNSLRPILLPSQVLSWERGYKLPHTSLHLSICFPGKLTHNSTWNRLSNEWVNERMNEFSIWGRITALFLWA